MDPMAYELLRAVGAIAVGGAIGSVAALVAFALLERLTGRSDRSAG